MVTNTERRTVATATNPRAEALRFGLHTHCFACAPGNPHGLRLSFCTDENGVTHVTWTPTPEFQSYNGRIHGGILATLIDASMVHALFALGVAGVTAEMNLRYHAPVLLNAPVEVATWVEAHKLGLYRLRAEVRQAGCKVVTAHAKFMAIPDTSAIKANEK
jgi:acyl-coenzyme A thioesterase PaaI-like protein